MLNTGYYIDKCKCETNIQFYKIWYLTLIQADRLQKIFLFYEHSLYEREREIEGERERERV